jgi:hypothetical protein
MVRTVCAIKTGLAVVPATIVSVPKFTRMVVTPVPVSLPLPLRGAIPICIGTMPLLPIFMPTTLFAFIEIVVIAVLLVIDMMPIIMLTASVPIIAILGQQVRRNEQGHGQR